MTPLQRFFNLLKLDKRDVYQIIFYAAFAGLVNLSLPLGIQSIINFIQSGQGSVSLVVLIVLVTIGVAFAGMLNIMQFRILENLQQRIFVRTSFEFAYRMPLIKFKELYNKYPPEQANRFFDTLILQKGTTKLLLDFSSSALQISFGIILLSLYHYFFMILGFFLVLLLYIIFKFSYKDGMETSLTESGHKYKVAAWLQEIARNRESFGQEPRFDFALSKNDRHVSGYINFKEKHFKVMRRQYIQLIIFKVFITAALLSIGGFLVINDRLNIGQFVASEILILMLINSVEKIVFGLDTFYDVLTSAEKIGQITDMETSAMPAQADTESRDLKIEVSGVTFNFPESTANSLKDINLEISQGERILVTGSNGMGKSTLLGMLAGKLEPQNGAIYITDNDINTVKIPDFRAKSRSLLKGETLFEGTIRENIVFGDADVKTENLKWALDNVGLSSYVKNFKDGLETHIHPNGKELSASDIQKILLARCIVTKPGILFLDDPTDKMDKETSNKIVNFLTNERKWTLVVVSNKKIWREKCDRMLEMENGQIVNDIILN
ncbi:MAG: ABC transporter ATP-binding protein [Flavobacterium sp.]|nr:MAG: ABC transporter ATP-binding protein [Flavobacterium sp.]